MVGSIRVPILLERLILLRKFLDSGTNGKRESAVASPTFCGWAMDGVCSVPNLIKERGPKKKRNRRRGIVNVMNELKF